LAGHRRTRAERPSLACSRRPRARLRQFDYYLAKSRPFDFEADLARKAANGDEVAFGVLVKRHRRRLERVVRRYLAPEDAQDVLQEVFISVWRNLSRYDPQRPFKLWLDYIVLNKCRDAARRSVVRQKAQFSFQTMISPVTPETCLLKVEATDRLRRAIETLPPTRKAALILTLGDDYSQSEAAQALGVTVKSIETRLHHARQHLAGLVRASDLADLMHIGASQHPDERTTAGAAFTASVGGGFQR
jgi:RNA polymerase sigma factor CnrH